MKIILTLLTLLSVNTAYSAMKCDVSLKPIGIYFYQCPRGTVAEGADAYNSGPNPYPVVRVACVKPEVICLEVNPLDELKDIQVPKLL